MNGYTLMHEHITIDLSGVKKDIDCKQKTAMPRPWRSSRSSMSAASAELWT